MANRDFISHAKLTSILHYEPNTGIFTWIESRGRLLAGKEAGSVTKVGYREITAHGTQYLAHRLAWFYVHGSWPQFFIDHINGTKDDNRIANLRDVERFSNFQNTPALSENSATGVRGVSFHRGIFKAEIRVNNVRRYLGVFTTLEDASKAYLDAKREMTGIHNFPR